MKPVSKSIRTTSIPIQKTPIILKPSLTKSSVPVVNEFKQTSSIIILPGIRSLVAEGIFLFAQQTATRDSMSAPAVAAQELLPTPPTVAQLVKMNFPGYNSQVQLQLTDLLETEQQCRSLPH